MTAWNNMLRYYPSQTIRYWDCLPTLEALRQSLAPEPLNTGRTIISPHGIVTDDVEAPYAILDRQGRVRLAVGQEFSYWLYRGQTCDWPACKSGLARLDAPRDQILKLARTVAFEDVVESHPLVIKARGVSLLGSPLSVDLTGIAQHYDLCTDMLDLTCNFMVASFFATCRFHRRRGRWEPVRATAEPGVIYRASKVHLGSTQEASEHGSLEIVGWQPFPRPEQQRAFAIRLKQHHDFRQHPHTERFLFRQDKGVSARIYEMFEGGTLLFPEDSVAQLADEAKRVKTFTRGQLERAWRRLEDWLGHTVDEQDRSVAETGAGIAEVVSSPLSWWGKDSDYSEARAIAELEALRKRVRCRLVSDHYQQV